MEQEKQITTAAEWKKRSAAGHDLEVPSGALCQVRRADLRVFMKTGRIPNSLRSIMDSAIGGKDIDTTKLANDVLDNPELLDDMMTMVDTIVVECVMQPKVYPVPTQGRPREPEFLYVDEIDLEDRMFIFNWTVGGSSDLERFREEQGTALATVHAVAADAVSAERAPGSDG